MPRYHEICYQNPACSPLKKDALWINLDSGINPATLTGAIDVIVVRRRDENGDYVYSCSPFHVRFGKLQVLRAGEKKVTIQLPDNLPASSSTSPAPDPAEPITPDASTLSKNDGSATGAATTPPKGFEAPFWMKVGEAGEAFFVVETDEEVPLELQTSPVVAAVDAPLTPPTSDEELFGSVPKRSRKGKEKASEEAELSSDGARPFDGGDGGGKTNIDDRSGSSPGITAEPTFLDLDTEDLGGGTTDQDGGESSSELEADEQVSAKDFAVNAEGSSSSETTASRLDTSSLKSSRSIVGLSSVSPSSILSTASSFIPSALKPSSSSSSLKSGSDNATPVPKDSRPPTPPPNPLRKESDPESHCAPQIKDYMKDAVENATRKAARRMSSVSSIVTGGQSGGVADVEKTADKLLPAIKAGEGEGPDVIYKHDVVLDMQGYHNEEQNSLPDDGEAKRPESHDDPIHSDDPLGAESADILDGITESLKADLHSDITAGSDDKITTKLISFTQDLIASAETSVPASLPPLPTGSGAATFPRLKRRPEVDVSAVERRLNHLDISTGRIATPTPKENEDSRVRATSEPLGSPEDGEEAITDIAGQELSDSYTWAWGELPLKTPTIPDGLSAMEEDGPAKPEGSSLLPHLDTPIRRNSAPGLTPSAPIRITGAADGPDPLTSRPMTGRAKTQPIKLDDSADENAERLSLDELRSGGKLKNSEANPHRFILDMGLVQHVFEIALWDAATVPEDIAPEAFASRRITFQSFIEDPNLVDSPKLVMMYDESFISWQNASPVMAALAIYRKSLQPPTLAASPGDALPPLASIGVDPSVVAPPASKGYGWSRWWRRGQPTTAAVASGSKVPTSPARPDLPTAESEPTLELAPLPGTKRTRIAPPSETTYTHYAKTLRLSSDQLSQLNLKEGPNKVIFSVTSSYSGVASCTARIFLWDESDHVVISDIDGTITKSDALGHVFAAIGRDWTHLGVAKLYTDICNNGYKIMYLTSRAIGQADFTRDYLKGIHQGRYQLPDGPVIMSPDRLMASLHREVIMRKPEIFKMACLRDIQRLFASASRNPFYAGFGNRITDAMSYRSVNIPSSRIFTIDSGGEVKMELLELVGYKSSYIHMTDLVDQMFPPIHRKITPEYSDFNYWRPAIMAVELPDFAPVSPALSATSEGSGRISVLLSLTSLGRRTSRTPVAVSEDGSIGSGNRPKAHSNASRSTSPLFAAYTASDTEDDELSDSEDLSIGARKGNNTMPGSLPGSYNRKHSYLHDGAFIPNEGEEEEEEEEEMDDERYHRAQSEPPNQTYGSWDGSDGAFEARSSGRQVAPDEEEEYPDMEFDDEMLATGEMSKVPY